ncbi:MAG TPA: hypothetical protein VMQ83_07470 [Gammaproteobacteria bacterium]|nr:hypothetical protein [Gammaproteobacteria bacterium]
MSCRRYLKAHRYGVGFEDSLTRKRDRLATLLLIHAMVCFVAWVAAKAAPQATLCAVTMSLVRSTRPGVLSWHRIGWGLLREYRWRLDIRIAMVAIQGDGDALSGRWKVGKPQGRR